MEELKNWIKENPLAFGGVLSLMSYVFCLWGLFGFGSSKGLGLAV